MCIRDSNKTVPVAGFTTATVSMQQQQDFSTTSAITKPGFVSAKAQYDEIVEQQRIQNIEKRAAQAKTPAEAKPKGRKRQIEGQGTIASFFKKPSLSTESSISMQSSDGPVEKQENLPRPKQPLQELRNHNPAPSLLRPAPTHKLPSAPLMRRPLPSAPVQSASQNNYMFLSSSPPQPEDGDLAGGNNTSDTTPTSDAADAAVPTAKARPASTFHTTSMQTMAPQRKTLGTRRSLHGWSARGGKR